MTWEVAVAGTFHNDDLTTPAGRRDALGGSAVYFPLAVARYAPVHVNGIVGSDTAPDFRRILAHPGIDLEGIRELCRNYRQAIIDSGETLNPWSKDQAPQLALPVPEFESE